MLKLAAHGKLRAKLVGGLGLAVLLAATISLVAGPTVAQALMPSDFQAGDIIDDAHFYSTDAMSVDEIQTFLNNSVGTCQSGAANLCLNVYHGDVAARGLSKASNGNVQCLPFAGGSNISAATIIYTVQAACNISAKVILATLQKEQGLVTSKNPSVGALNAAMGYDCPDTAPCATASLGFGNQVYLAAWQFSRYRAAGVGKRPGVQSIAYNFNPQCGASNVNVLNNATAGLYTYTPYQPNPATLATLTGSAPPCGAYGNRNFWYYYNSWFGPSVGPSGQDQIGTEYAAQGGQTTLGAATSDILAIVPNWGGLGQAFQNGSIYWNSSVGAKTVWAGPLMTYYFAQGGAAGAMGWPALNQGPITLNGGGISQLFTGGSLYSSAAGTFLVTDPIRTGYFAQSGANGVLGFPSADQVCPSGQTYCSQSFTGGAVYSSNSTGTFALSGDFFTAFTAAGGATGTWGLPTSALGSISQNGGGTGQAFANGSAYEASGGSPHFVSGAVRDYYFSLGGAAGSLGYPTTNTTCNTAGTTCSENFQRGGIIWDSTTGARQGSADIDAEHTREGGDTGTLGVQTSPLTYYSFNGGGLAEGYANGSIYDKPALGAFSVVGAIRTAYFAQGGVAGPDGWPTSDQQCAAGTCSQTFENAVIVSSPSGTFSASGAIQSAYTTSGGTGGTWGLPSSAAAAIPQNGGGIGQAFTNGSVYVATGGAAHFVLGNGLRDYYFSLGGAAGSLGFPTSDTVCSTDKSSCSQAFQRGGILWTLASGAQLGSADIDAEHTKLGGDAGAIGKQTSPVAYYAYNGGGIAAAYAGGSIYDKPSLGAFGVMDPIRAAFFAQGGVAGAFGWPTADAVCAGTPSVCSQSFEGGMIYASSTGAFATTGAISLAYAAAGGPTGSWGLPTGSSGAIAQNGRGVGQPFVGGSAYAPVGGNAHLVVAGAELAYYFTLGGAAGRLGFPLGDATCVSAGLCTQSFQHGTITANSATGTEQG